VIGPATTPRAGFTLVEVMVSSTLAAIIMAAVLSTYVMIGRNLARLSSYQSLEHESRKALVYLSRDFMQTQSVKGGTIPTDSSVTLVLPLGEVSYTYDSVAKSLRRQATFGTLRDVTFLHNDSCECSSFSFAYYTSSGDAPTNPATPTVNVPFSIKQIEVGYVAESPSSWTAETRTRCEQKSSRYVFRNRGAPDGT
jgi:prepilin-type N-terminal cleavage/methylation domain-containing protein